MRRAKLRVGVCTGGGDCPGLNAAVRAVVRHGVGTHGMEIIGIRDGLTGLAGPDGPLTMALPYESVGSVLDTGGTILGTNNKGSPLRDKDEAKRTIDGVCAGYKKLKLDAVIVIGGDGTHFMAKQLAKAGLALVGIPKTIDNDLVGTDLTIGFSTAVDIASDAAARLRSSADAHNRIMILEVMGRDAGHIALSSAIATGAHVALLPEIPFVYGALAKRFAARQALGRESYLIICAEGAHATGDKPSFLQGATGNKALGGIGEQVARALHEQSGADARVAVLGHIQRGGSPNTADRILATRLGTAAVDLVAAGRYGRIVGMQDGAVIDFAYRSVNDVRRKIDLTGPDVAAAEAVGIYLGRPTRFTRPY